MNAAINFFFKAYRLFFTFTDQAYGVIPVFEQKNQRLYLIVLSKSNKWVFAKGHSFIGEDDLAAAIRELREETGVEVTDTLKNFSINLNYTFKLLKVLPISKKVKFFVGFTKKTDVKIDQKELIDHKWASLAESVNLLTFKNSQEILKKIDVVLNNTKLNRHPGS